MAEIFQIQHLTFSYPEQPALAIQDLSLAVERGEFLVLCGPSGCGKTTLLRQFKSVMAPHGRRTGEILFEGRPLDELDQREQTGRIGFVQQSPENQIVTDKVWHELAFGLESLGYDTPTIRRRVAEMASFFGIQTWFYKNVTELSGGQKQLLNLASIMAMQPSVLILDEPTSQLDPIAASDFLAVLGRINRELGTTIILTEHRLEDAFPLAARAAMMDRGKLLCVGTPAEVGAALRDAGHGMFLAMPAPMRIWAASEKDDAPCPVTVREGKDWLESFAVRHEFRPLPEQTKYTYTNETAIHAEEIWFRYEKDLPDVVKGLSLPSSPGRQRYRQNLHTEAPLRPAEALSGNSGAERQRRRAAPESPDTVCEKDRSGGPTGAAEGRGHRPGGIPLPAGGAAGPAPLRPLRRRAAAGGAGEGTAAGAGYPPAGRAHQGTGRGVQTGIRGDFADTLAPGRDRPHGQP